MIYPLLLGLLYPEPEIKGYVSIAGFLYSILFFMFNVPTNFAIERWVADFRIKNPNKMAQYISFYIWYQMTSGVILITSTSLYTIYVVEQGNLAYLSWLMLVLITREYPAMLHIFLQSIKGLQKFAYESKINFIKSIWEKLFEFGFVVLGRFWIGRNPVIGPLLGAAIGYAIGTYVDDFASAFLSAWYLKRPLNELGLRLRDIVRPNFGKDVFISSLKFGFKLSIPGMFSSVIGFSTTYWWLTMVPHFITFQVLNGLADEIANLSKRSEGINTKGAFAEALNNGKMNLAQYYIMCTFKYYGFFTIGIACIVIGFMPTILNALLVVGGAENYLLAIPFIVPNIIATLFEQPAGEADKILTMGHRPLFKSATAILLTFLGLFFTYLYLFVWKIPQTYGYEAIVWLFPLGGLIPNLIIIGIRWWYIDKYICSVKKAIKSVFWQAFVAPVIPGLISILIGNLWYYLVYPVLQVTLGSIVAAGISVTFAFLFGLVFCFVVLYGAFGGWDDHTLSVFKEAVYNSGPSRIFFIPVYKLTKFLCKISPLHNRFPVDYKDAEREAIELMIQRRKVEQLMKEKRI
ncbi:MAG: hypothetical protein ACTSRA_21490 [Promethearchaeota archaeon]